MGDDSITLRDTIMKFRNLIISFLFLLSPYLVIAETDYVPQILKDLLKWLFFTLPEQARQGDIAFVIYFKFLLWILVYAVLYAGTKRVFKDSNRIAGTVAFVLAIISVLLIPDKVLLFIFGEFTGVISILLGLLPVLVGLYFWRQLHEQNRLLATVILILVAIVSLLFGSFMVAYAETAQGEDAKLYGQAGQWSLLIGIIVLIFGVIGFITAMTMGRGSGATSSSTPGTWSSNNSVDNAINKQEADARKQAEEREKIDKNVSLMLENLKQYEADELQELSKLISYLRYVISIAGNLSSYILTKKPSDVIRNNVATLISDIKNKIVNFKSRHLEIRKNIRSKLKGLIEGLEKVNKKDKRKEKDDEKAFKLLVKKNKDVLRPEEMDEWKKIKKDDYERKVDAYIMALAKRLEEIIDKDEKSDKDFYSEIGQALNELESVMTRWIVQRGFRKAIGYLEKALEIAEEKFKLDEYFEKIDERIEEVEKMMDTNLPQKKKL